MQIEEGQSKSNLPGFKQMLYKHCGFPKPQNWAPENPKAYEGYLGNNNGSGKICPLWVAPFSNRDPGFYKIETGLSNSIHALLFDFLRVSIIWPAASNSYRLESFPWKVPLSYELESILSSLNCFPQNHSKYKMPVYLDSSWHAEHSSTEQKQWSHKILEGRGSRSFESEHVLPCYFLISKWLFYFMCSGVFVCIYVCPCLLDSVPSWPEEVVWGPGTGVIDVCEPSCWWCVLNPGLLPREHGPFSYWAIPLSPLNLDFITSFRIETLRGNFSVYGFFQKAASDFCGFLWFLLIYVLYSQVLYIAIESIKYHHVSYFAAF